MFQVTFPLPSFTVVVFFPSSAFNILLNFGIAITYPTLISLGIVLSVPVNAGKNFCLLHLNEYVKSVAFQIPNRDKSK